MKNSVDNLIQDIMSLRGETVSVFGQPYRVPTETSELTVDVVDVMQAWRGYEADLTISKLDYELIEELQGKIEEIEAELEEAEDEFLRDVLELTLEELRDELEEAEENYIEEEADSIEDFLEHLDMLYGLEEKYSGNTYNQCGNISNHYYEHHFECGDGCHYVTLAVHRYGDVRANYTEEVLLKFDSDWEALEIISEGGSVYHDIDINGEAYEIRVDARQEDIEVFDCGYNYVCTIYGADTLEEAREKIAEKLGIELVA